VYTRLTRVAGARACSRGLTLAGSGQTGSDPFARVEDDPYLNAYWGGGTFETISHQFVNLRIPVCTLTRNEGGAYSWAAAVRQPPHPASAAPAIRRRSWAG
jgi:hypothetical protein